MAGERRLFARVPQMARRLGGSNLSRQAGWIAGPYAMQQVIRFGTQILLARLLAPEMFGLMLVINTLRTGMELLSDVGIGQSVVRSANGDNEEFLATAWTLQLLRGLLLTVVAIAAAFPVAELYEEPQLAPILIAVSPVFLFTGLLSPSLFLMQRHIKLRERATYDILCSVFQCILTIALAAAMQSVWALVWGLVISTAFSTALTYAIGERFRPRLCWNKAHFREIVGFGKWIFLSTVVYFAATSTDRLYFVGALPLALAGVYGVARTFSEVVYQFAQRAGAQVVFPRLAAMREQRSEEADRLRKKRFHILALVAIGLAIATAGADRFILFAYDERYHAAAFMLPLLLAGTWFAVLASFADAMLMGCSKPAPGAFGNATKFAILLVFLPLAMARGGLFEGLLVLILAEAGRWAVLAPALHRERLGKIRDDVALTVIFAVALILAKLALGWTGLAPSFAEWWALGALADA